MSWRSYSAIGLTVCALLLLAGILTALGMEGRDSEQYQLKFLVVRRALSIFSFPKFKIASIMAFRPL